MTMTLNIPTPETLLRQVARWCALHTGGYGGAAVLPPGGGAAFPMSMMFADAERPEAVRAFPAHETVWARALPALPSRQAMTGAGGADGVHVSFTLDAAPGLIGGGIDAPTRVLAVRVNAESKQRRMAVGALAAFASVLGVPGYAPSGRAFVFAGAASNGDHPLSAEAFASLGAGGGPHGFIGTPPPEVLVANAATPLWRVLGVEEISPIQVVSDEIGAANAAGVPGASGAAQAATVLGFRVAAGVVQRASAALRVTRGGLGAGDDAAVRVLPPSGARPVLVEAATVVSGAVSFYVYDGGAVGATLAQLAAQMAADGWTVVLEDGAASRRAADLCAMDWRRATTAALAGGAGGRIYVHGALTGGGGA